MTTVTMPIEEYENMKKQMDDFYRLRGCFTRGRESRAENPLGEGKVILKIYMWRIKEEFEWMGFDEVKIVEG